MSETVEVEAPRRGRPSRAQQVASQRRRRKSGTLDRMVQMKLDCVDAEALDLDNYVYRWVNDEPGKIRAATRQDDYEFVTASELGETFDAEATDSESSERVRMVCGKNADGSAIHTYLCKKPRSYWEHDNEQMVQAREDMMAGRVYRGEATEDDERRSADEETFYVPAGNQIGHAGERRRGPIPRKLK